MCTRVSHLSLSVLMVFFLCGTSAHAQDSDLLSAKPIYGQPPIWNELVLGRSSNAEAVERLGSADTTLDAGRTVLHLYGQGGGGEARVTVVVWDDVVHMIQLQASEDERTTSAVRDKYGKPPLTFEGTSESEDEPRLEYRAYPEKGVVFAVESGSSLVRKYLVSERALNDLQSHDS